MVMAEMIPYLCGGTFFVLLLRTKRNRAKKEIQKYGSGGVTNPELLKSLVMLFDPDYVELEGSSLSTNTSLYKSCQISDADCLPFHDAALIKAFDGKIRTDYFSQLSEMKRLADFFLTTEKEAKMRELAYGLLNLIKDDGFNKPEESFYVLQSGKPVTKQELLLLTDINLYALLLGVWHHILMYRKDNTKGKATIEAWHRLPEQKGDGHEFISTIGESYSHGIKISTALGVQDGTAEKVSEPKEDDSCPFEKVEATITPDAPIQTVPTVTQTFQNQFNISQSGNGINIGHAEKVEIRDGKVVTLK